MGSTSMGELIVKDGGVPEEKIVKVDEIQQLYDMLLAGRIHCIAYTPEVLMWFIKSKKYDLSKLEFIYKKKVGEFYIAFSKGVNDKLINDYQHAWDKVAQDTKLVEEIRSKYLN
ncbi:MAG: hypothetical protein HRU09_08060 [Oligoflexales bacterium]|nr:hypothetical protein [Oligoflexales bacterium]